MNEIDVMEKKETVESDTINYEQLRVQLKGMRRQRNITSKTGWWIDQLIW